MGASASGAVLIADIAAATQLRARVGDRAADAELDALIGQFTRIVEERGGRVLKSDGDDILAVFNQAGAALEQAAQSAAECQRAARTAGRSLYAGVHAGEIELREVLGRPDVSGMAVNMAARLHKLVPDLPGHIFLTIDSVLSLGCDLRDRARPYGVRAIKGVGTIEVYTLDWNEADTVMPTRFADTGGLSLKSKTCLVLQSRGRTLRLKAGGPSLVVGRDRRNGMSIDDEEQRVSSRHLSIECRNSDWIVHEISRNGTWLHFEGGRKEIHLLGEELKLVGDGWMCLGRPLAADDAGQFTIRFELRA